MREVWNFSAGPSQLPIEVLSKIQKDLFSYNNTGMSVMELSHRSGAFVSIVAETENRLRRLLNLPDDYAVLFLQGGASLQFSMVPLNLMKSKKAAYIHTGTWSHKARQEAERAGMNVEVLASSEDKNFTYIPDISDLPDKKLDYDYIHLTSNNTIEGTAFKSFPETGKTPLVADMSSNILSEPLDVSPFGLIYAGAQKNLGIAGLTLIILHKKLLNLNPQLPNMLNYHAHYEKHSAYNTPPTFSIYVLSLVLEWLEKLGGLKQIAEKNRIKANKLYRHIEESYIFKSPVYKHSRSIMNIPFTTGDEALDKKFIKFSEKRNIQNIKGHASVGGMRASIYNAMPFEGVEALIEVMTDFEHSLKGGK
jgi:phosphoserine aminotransferase